MSKKRRSSESRSVEISLTPAEADTLVAALGCADRALRQGIMLGSTEPTAEDLAVADRLHRLSERVRRQVNG